MIIQAVNSSSLISSVYQDFLHTLQQTGFVGEIESDYATRTVFATDNSIYQRLPQAIVFPATVEDVSLLASLMAQPAFTEIVITARGGGTGTNGQSLTDGIVVDLSRHLNRVLEINVDERWARVQAGVVKDQLNALLKPHGLFFSPELSTSNRATIGGMINTDASGQGSCVYGKTRDHVIELDTVVVGGEQLHTQAITATELAQHTASLSEREASIYQSLDKLSSENAALIASTFPKLNRCLTGYDLAHLNEKGEFNLNSVICGSEGTLGFVVEAKLNLLPIPNYSVLINLRYPSFMDALRDAKTLMEHQPLSIETVDSRVLQLAQKDSVWQSVCEYFPDDSGNVLGINLIEFSGDSKSSVDTEVSAFLAYLEQDQSIARSGYTLAAGEDAVKRVYGMRKRAVGLLGNSQGEARPQPFIEDMAVPPENLADFIAELRDLLDGHELQYGMFGHVDAGVLHVRPALDMKDPEQAALIRPITDHAVKLIEKYGGLLWGEHGKGLRSEYVPQFFGDLYPAIQQVKSLFDPNNQLNPGKIASPLGSAKDALLKIDGVALRGEYDRQIAPSNWQSFGASMHCNGNGACYNYDVNDAMCPSWKATRQRIHSPKGRASAMREWLRLQQLSGVDAAEKERASADYSSWQQLKQAVTKKRRKAEDSFNHEVYDAMAGCLACKSCVGQCPVKVNIPELRSRFLFLYHQRYFRPLREYLVASLEFFIPYLSRVSPLYNGVMGQAWVKRLLAKTIGMVDSPLFDSEHPAFQANLQQWGVKTATAEELSQLSAAEKERCVVLVQDTFTRYFDTRVLAALVELMSELGYSVWLAKHLPNGKPLHVQGFRTAFAKTAQRNIDALNALAALNVTLVGLDPAMTLIYRQEYAALTNAGSVPEVLLPQEWLMKHLPESSASTASATYKLFMHCTEKTNAASSTAQWQAVFKRRGLPMSVVSTGCCGMSGTYGHELRNLDTSTTIFQQSWAPQLAQTQPNEEVLATGYSCRSQVKRMQDVRLKHPVEVLLDSVKQERATH
ncbi:lactate dehydrogenase-like protein [Methylophaga frappieri]|uniref:D-2-hydroxyglutarate dehydrogenase n=1 Tax=Methylophaga frappieri (strain ATCC BAA-2434 / DSM 25690 / JAM7) TaxID=754477 RepID=I1YG95_METFJ|nr:FAD-binding and (Fe-S)-binding domain-containing protein [Methylophaga frappieri]AFJ01938.1 lactate dehydrogenase-like protein [Methylophaga frappieri]